MTTRELRLWFRFIEVSLDTGEYLGFKLTNSKRDDESKTLMFDIHSYFLYSTTCICDYVLLDGDWDLTVRNIVLTTFSGEVQQFSTLDDFIEGIRALPFVEGVEEDYRKRKKKLVKSK